MEGYHFAGMFSEPLRIWNWVARKLEEFRFKNKGTKACVGLYYKKKKHKITHKFKHKNTFTPNSKNADTSQLQ